VYNGSALPARLTSGAVEACIRLCDSRSRLRFHPLVTRWAPHWVLCLGMLRPASFTTRPSIEASPASLMGQPPTLRLPLITQLRTQVSTSFGGLLLLTKGASFLLLDRYQRRSTLPPPTRPRQCRTAA